MSNKTKLPTNIIEEIKTRANTLYNSLHKASMARDPYCRGLSMFESCQQPLIDHLTEYATKLHEAQQENKEWKEECDRLAKLVEFWQGKYNELKGPSFTMPKIDNNPIA